VIFDYYLSLNDRRIKLPFEEGGQGPQLACQSLRKINDSLMLFHSLALLNKLLSRTLAVKDPAPDSA
jgi:hypothetical protein